MKSFEEYMKVKPTGLALLPGRILISVPFFQDPFFNRTVVLLTDYSMESCAGLVINRETDFTVREVATDIKIDDPLYFGGPVLANTVFCVHNHEANTSSINLLDGVYLGYDELFLALIEHKAVDSIRYKFFLGYSGWEQGQLEKELQSKMWLVANATPELLFKTPSDEIWEKALSQFGDSYGHWLNIPINLEDN